MTQEVEEPIKATDEALSQTRFSASGETGDGLGDEDPMRVAERPEGAEHINEGIPQPAAMLTPFRRRGGVDSPSMNGIRPFFKGE